MRAAVASSTLIVEAAWVAVTDGMGAGGSSTSSSAATSASGATVIREDLLFPHWTESARRELQTGSQKSEVRSQTSRSDSAPRQDSAASLGWQSSGRRAQVDSSYRRRRRRHHRDQHDLTSDF